MEALSEHQRGDGGATPRSGAAGVIVLGSGRSGTSAIAHAFVAAGFFAGREGELYGSDPGNPLGHYEYLAALRTNEELLARLGCGWWAGTPPLESQLTCRAEVAPRLKAIVDGLVGSADDAPVVLKEPRINGLLPLWRAAIDGILHPVLAIRDPLEIALSHSRRDGTSAIHALASWEMQTTLILSWLDGRIATVAPYAELIARPALAGELVSAAAAHLDPARASRADPAAAAAALRPEQRKENAAGLVHGDYLSARQVVLWRYLSNLPAGDACLALPADLRRPSDAAAAALRSENERMALLSAHAALVEEDGRKASRIADLERRLEEMVEVARREAAIADRNGRELAVVRRSPSWRLTAPLRRVKRASRRSAATPPS